MDTVSNKQERFNRRLTMSFDLPVGINNLNINYVTILFGIYMITIGFVYYFIFNKHHKKNKIKLDELITLVTKFYVSTIITTILVVVGIGCIIGANEVKDTRSDVIMSLLLGIIIITIAISYYVFYIKRSLKDIETEVRIQNRKAALKIGEVLELIFFIIFITMPIWRIPKFIELIGNKRLLAIEIVRAFGLCIAALILLDALNPFDIKGKVKKLFTKK